MVLVTNHKICHWQRFERQSARLRSPEEITVRTHEIAALIISSIVVAANSSILYVTIRRALVCAEFTETERSKMTIDIPSTIFVELKSPSPFHRTLSLAETLSITIYKVTGLSKDILLYHNMSEQFFSFE